MIYGDAECGSAERGVFECGEMKGFILSNGESFACEWTNDVLDCEGAALAVAMRCAELQMD